MNYRYTYFHGSQGHASEPRHGGFEHHMWGPGDGFSRRSFSSRLGAGEGGLRWLPWAGAAAIGLGVLIILFPMLLVMAVAGLFFFAGAALLGLWWHARDRSHATFDAANEWNRLKRWLKERLA